MTDSDKTDLNRTDLNKTDSWRTDSTKELERFFADLMDLVDRDSTPFNPYQRMWRLARNLEKAYYEDPICVADPDAALVSLVMRLDRVIKYREPSLVLEPAIKFLNSQEELDADRTQHLLAELNPEQRSKLTQVWRWAVGLSNHTDKALPAEQTKEIVLALDDASHCPLWQSSLARMLLEHVENLEVSLVWRCCEIIHFAEKQHPEELMDHLNKLDDPNWSINAATLVSEWTAEFLIESLPEGIQQPNHLISAIRFFAKSKRSVVTELRAYTITNWDQNVWKTFSECGFENLIVPGAYPRLKSNVPSRTELEEQASAWPFANVTEWIDKDDSTSQVLCYLRSELRHGNFKPFAAWLQAMEENADEHGEYQQKLLLSNYSLELNIELQDALSTGSPQDLECILPGLQYFVDFPYHMDHVAQWNSELLFVHLLSDRAGEYVDWSKSTLAHWIAGIDCVWDLAARRADKLNLSDADRWELALRLCTRGLKAGIKYQTDPDVDKTDLTLPYGPDEMVGLVTKERLATHGGQLADILDDQGETWRRLARIRRQLGQLQPAIEAIDAALEQTEDEKIRSRREAEKRAYQKLLEN